MITLKNIAEKAEVSIRTVRRVISGEGGVRKDRYERVQAALVKLDYVPDLFASSLRSRNRRVIGIIASDLASEVLNKKLSDLQLEAGKRGYTTLFALTGGNMDEEMRICAQYAKTCSGLILLHDIRDTVIKRLNNFGTPYVFSDSYLQIPNAISIDRKSGVKAAIISQLQQYRNFVFLSNNTDKNEARKDAFIETMKKEKIKSYRIMSASSIEFSGGENAAAEIAEQKSTLTVCYNDRLAAGLLKKLYSEKCRIPEDYGIVGFDNDCFTEYTQLALSTVTQSTKELAEKTFDLLQDMLAGKKEIKAMQVETKFIGRETTEMPAF